MKRTPKFRNFMDTIDAVVTGYYTSGQVEIGPYFNLYSFNPVEGNRFPHRDAHQQQSSANA
ncbi:MAG: hypothetical protein IPP33_05980 [Flavobacteriales bacterium]|nr:hypothetical protein [Flavobacteriales bacterium]